MGADKYYRRYIEKAIQSNPTTIVIRRIQRIDDGYDGFIEEEIELDPQTVTFYNRKSQREIIQDKGQTIGYLSSNTEKILCTHDTDIQDGDYFNANDREYRVIFVDNYLDICKQVELEVVQ